MAAPGSPSSALACSMPSDKPNQHHLCGRTNLRAPLTRRGTTLLLLVMACRLLGEFRQASTRLDTPPLSIRYHPDSVIAPTPGDQVVAIPILDRLLHHSHVLTIRGDSYRLREKRRSELIKATQAPASAGASQWRRWLGSQCRPWMGPWRRLINRSSQHHRNNTYPRPHRTRSTTNSSRWKTRHERRLNVEG